jgi:hypothetical protein
MLCVFFLFTAISAISQNPLDQAFAKVQMGTQLPEGLQSTRSIVFLKADQSTPLGSPQGPEILNQQFHIKLAEMHIDPVAYYRWQDLIAGFDATVSYMETIKDRDAKQIIVLNANAGQYQISIVPTADDSEIFDSKIKAWQATNSSLEAVVEDLAVAVRRSDLEIANFLIAETPEIFIDTQIFKKNRFPSFQPDLKLDKLAAPLFHSTDVKEVTHPADSELMAILNEQYPFQFEVVSSQMTEDLMRKAGFQYVLRYLHGEESTLQTLLDYREPASTATKAMYKFYVKHLISGDIYLGDTWDSRSTWQSAINIHLSNMKRSLKVK